MIDQPDIKQYDSQVQICHPKYLTAREIQKILEEPKLFELLDEPIQRIIKTEGGYLLFTSRYQLQVDVHYLLSEEGRIGGVHLELEFHNPEPAITNCLALHPKYEVANELIAILQDCRLFEKLGNEVIQSISKTENGYQINSQSLQIDVHVKYLPPESGIIGAPHRFELEFLDPVYLF